MTEPSVFHLSDSTLFVGAPEIFDNILESSRFVSCVQNGQPARGGQQTQIAVLRVAGTYTYESLLSSLGTVRVLNYVKYAAGQRLTTLSTVTETVDRTGLVISFLCGLDGEENTWGGFIDQVLSLYDDLRTAYFFVHRDFYFFVHDVGFQFVGFSLPDSVLENDREVKSAAARLGRLQRLGAQEGLVMVRTRQLAVGTAEAETRLTDLSRARSSIESPEHSVSSPQPSPEPYFPAALTGQRYMPGEFSAVEPSLRDCLGPVSTGCSFSFESLERVFKFFASARNRLPGGRDKEQQKVFEKYAQSKWDLNSSWLRRQFDQLRGESRCALVSSFLPTVLQDYVPLDIVDTGAYGLVLKTYSRKRGQNEILKISMIDVFTRQTTRSEFQLLSQAALYGVAPAAYEEHVFQIEMPEHIPGLGPQPLGPATLEAIAMMPLDMTMFSAIVCLKSEPEKLQVLGKSLNSLLRRSSSLCLTHGDLHLKNILFKFKETPTLYLVDFSRASFDFSFPDIDLIQVARGLHIANLTAKLSDSQLSILAADVFDGLDKLPGVSHDLVPTLLFNLRNIKRLNELFDEAARVYVKDLRAVQQGTNFGLSERARRCKRS
jgi:hypothetical protein